MARNYYREGKTFQKDHFFLLWRKQFNKITQVDPEE